MKGASLRYAPALPANIRLGWKGLPGTNALAYYEKSSLTAVKSFIICATGGTTTFKHIYSSIVNLGSRTFILAGSGGARGVEEFFYNNLTW